MPSDMGKIRKSIGFMDFFMGTHGTYGNYQADDFPEILRAHLVFGHAFLRFVDWMCLDAPVAGNSLVSRELFEG